LFLSSGY